MAASIAGLVTMTSVAAHAISFTPIKPAACPSGTAVPWKFHVGSFGSGEWMVPADENNQNAYSNNVNYVMGLVGNNWTQQFGVNVETFETHQPDDMVRLDNGWGTAMNLSGSAGNFGGGVTRGWQTNIPFGSTNSAIALWFKSDANLNTNQISMQSGVNLDTARVCTNGTVADFREYAVNAGQRYSGLLLGQNDVVYMVGTVGSDKACSANPTDDTFAMWGNGGGQDFDMYVRCGAQPTPTQYDFAALSGDDQEFIHVPAGACPCGSLWHIAIHSYSATNSGAGQFNFVHQKHLANQHRANSVWTEDCVVNSTTLASDANLISRGFKHFFGANEGGRYFSHIDLWNTTADPVDGDIRCSDGRPHSDRCCASCVFGPVFINMYRTWMTLGKGDITVSHEMGHHYNCLGDEYNTSNFADFCGHSIMASQFLANTNYCYCNNQVAGQPCPAGSGDHSRDPNPNAGTNSEGAVWVNLAKSVPFFLTTTPDNQSFMNFDFNGLYGVVTTH